MFRLSELDIDGTNSPDSQEDEDLDRIEEEEIDSNGQTSINNKQPVGVRSRIHAKERRMDRTKGCHLYTVTRPGNSHLKMVRIIFLI